jgi:hypothetical protein
VRAQNLANALSKQGVNVQNDDLAPAHSELAPEEMLRRQAAAEYLLQDRWAEQTEAGILRET